MDDSAWVVLGSVIGVHGVRGWIKVHSDTQPRENILDYAVWWFKGKEGWKEVRVMESQHTAKNVLALVEGVDDRDTAERLRGTEIAIPRRQLPATEANEYYWTDLIGLEVFGPNDVRFGTVDRLFETGANDVVVITDEREWAVGEKRPNGPEILVPWLRPDVVKEVDVERGRIVVDWDPDF